MKTMTEANYSGPTRRHIGYSCRIARPTEIYSQGQTLAMESGCNPRNSYTTHPDQTIYTHSCHRTWPMSPRTLYLLLALATLWAPCCWAADYPLFDAGNLASPGLQHMVYHQTTGSLLVGSTNAIHRLDGANLSPLDTRVTGPEPDNPGCTNTDCSLELVSTDNVNKVLLFLDDGGLVACGSLRQGTCQLLDPLDLSLTRLSADSVFVAANDLGNSTVALVAPGPGGEDFLYVGTSRTDRGTMSTANFVPMVSSRLLPNSDTDPEAFKIYMDVQVDPLFPPRTEIKVLPETDMSNPFNIDYIYSFSADGFTYFVTVQDRDFTTPGQNFVTKLVRVCQDDAHYRSFMEMPLVCDDGQGNHFELAQSAHFGAVGSELGSEVERALFVVFAAAPESGRQGLANSSLCVYPLQQIVDRFLHRIRECFSGRTEYNIDWNSGSTTVCQSASENQINQIDENFCNQDKELEFFILDFNDHLGGYDVDIPGTAFYHDSSALFTSVTVSEHEEKTAIFLGTSEGHLQKVRLSSSTEAVKYEEKTIVAGSPVARHGLLLTPDGDHLFVMTEEQITKLPVEECLSLYTNCDVCLAAGDPYCGWCSLDNRCSRQTSCEGNDKDNRWGDTLDQCIQIVGLSPSSLPWDQSSTVTIQVKHLPETDSGTFHCVFGSISSSVATVLSSSAGDETTELQCSSPLTSDVPRPGSAGFVEVELSLLATQTNEYIVSTTFSFYECQKLSGCMGCVDSGFPCKWCIYDNLCSLESCPTTSQADTISQRDKCPVLKAVAGGIVIPFGEERNIPLEGANLPQSNEYSCQLEFQVDGVTHSSTLGATWSDSAHLTCDPDLVLYSGDQASVMADISVQWKPGFQVDNPDNVQAEYYACDNGRSNCGDCLNALLENPLYECGWCLADDSCQIEALCGAGTGDWIDPNPALGLICPDPEIYDFEPAAGHIQGGTKLRIRGHSLGRVAQDIKGVKVANEDCTVLTEEYVTSQEVVCLTTKSQLGQTHGSVVVSVGKEDEVGYPATSGHEFQYVVPIIEAISPVQGPQSGGTLITITGLFLNAGTDIHTNLGSLGCTVIETANTYAICKTSKSDAIADYQVVTMYFDNGEAYNSQLEYSYKEDPTIKSVSLNRAILSGGNLIDVMGTSLTLISKPAMIIRVQLLGSNKLEDFFGSCSVINSTYMTCYAPNINITEQEDTSTVNALYKVDYGFILDGVENVTSLTTGENKFDKFEYYVDPVYTMFENGVYEYDGVGNELSIMGVHLDLATTERDVVVTIGASECKVERIYPDELKCQFPVDAPKGYDKDEGVEVIVYHGANLNFSLGRFLYTNADSGLPLSVIIGASAGGGVVLILLLILITVCVLYRVSSSEGKRQVKHLKVQMDVLESRVARECKEAFAELQTDVTEMTSDLEGLGIPFLDYRAYSMRVLFPGQEDHPVLSGFDVSNGRRYEVERGLREFGKLIHNKTFLLTFVRTLENQKRFAMKDRVNVASLIMVVLQKRMDYATEILKSLLAEVINKAMENKNPKLLLRRNESIAEKMLTNWLTFLLYKFLKDCAGEPLFMLYRAVKQQVEKGPVDSLTSDAKYSLSEDKLIRQQIEYAVLTLNVNSDTILDKEDHFVQVKVLDCDTISQVKEKALDAIYKNAPYSGRPAIEDIDIEWRADRDGRIILNDEDTSASYEGDWKRINTLAHFNVPDGAVMALVPKQGFSNLTMLSTNSNKSQTYINVSLASTHYSQLGTSTLLSNNSDSDRESRHRPWHLVRPHSPELHKEGERTSKMVSEIYLTRLLSTKGALQKFVDDLFDTVFTASHKGSALPLAIKYLFDFLDDQAHLHGITDPHVVHTWKSNSLPLRFWVNIIKNPDFVFDIKKSNIVDSCLSVVAQTFMDSCSTSDHKLGKDSPSSKLLYAKDIPNYKNMVEKYYTDIENMSSVSDQDMYTILADESREHNSEFYPLSALNELFYVYVQNYSDELITALVEDDVAQRSKLAYKLEQISAIIEGQLV